MEKLFNAFFAALCFAAVALVAYPTVKAIQAEIIAGLQFKMPEDRAGRPLNQR